MGFESLFFQWFAQWLHWEEALWPYLGLICGTCLVLAYLCRELNVGVMFQLSALAVAGFFAGIYFLLPYVSAEITGEVVNLPSWRLWVFGGEVVGSVVTILVFIRYSTPLVESLKNIFTKSSRLERNRRTDIRDIRNYLPNPQKTYNPEKFFSAKKGVFLGLNESRNPVYIPVIKWRQSHTQITGTTSCGKGVMAGVLLTQAIYQGETVFVFDPKNDEFLPHVMYRAAKSAGIPFIFIDLTGPQPQWNPLLGKSEYEIEELFSAGFGMGEKGTEADYHRLNDRRAARVLAGMVKRPWPTLQQALLGFLEQHAEVAERGNKFVSDLEEIAAAPVTHTSGGLNIAAVINHGGVVYVRGSMRNARILKLQRIFVLSVIQHCEARDRDSARQVCMFWDEFKYLISQPALEAIGAIRDKRAHVILAHQSLGDLRACPKDMDPDSVVSSVTENCALKATYVVQDPDTALRYARMSGEILVDDEVRQVKVNAGLSEMQDSERALKQATRHLVDTNMLHSLPGRCAVLYGVGLAQFFFTSPIPVTKSTEATTPTPFEASDFSSASGPKGGTTLTHDLLNVD
jgi:hypothetical protein